MKRINKLSKAVADKIAAGEIVDRPLSIVKELMENAIDAGADTIIVEIKNGGKSYIRVTDNGHGINGDEIDIAFHRHATSKISVAEDLSYIRTLGFRGEALAGISAVSKLECISKPHEVKTGHRILLNGGEIIEKSITGCPDGTTFIITDLFYNTPARRKFLKNDATESSYIIDFVSKMALAYSEIRIRLINNGTTLFFTPGTGDILRNIQIIYGREIGDMLIPVSKTEGSLSLLAYISPPDKCKIGKKNQVFFVNGRNIKSKLLEKAVSEAYAEKITEGRHPIVYLFLTDDPSVMDVNIHPAKQEIRFDDEDRILKFVTDSLRNGLRTRNAVPKIELKEPFKSPDFKVSIDAELPKDAHKQEDINSLFENLRETESSAYNSLSQQLESTEIIEEKCYGYPNLDLNKIIITGSIFGTYLTGMDGSHFYLIDQHAAHERIFYEQLMAKDSSRNPQILIAPFILELSHSMAAKSMDWLPVIQSMGYDIEEFGTKSYIIKGIPMFMSLEESREFIDYFMENLDEKDLKDPIRINKLIMSSCKNAVKAGDTLSHDEMVHLMKDLANTENPFSCPHGRPVFLRLSKLEIERMFKRR